MVVSVTGSYQNYQHIKVYIDYNSNDVFNLHGELILSGDGGTLTGNVVMP
ncbi:MAG: hypothetical protein ABJC12_00490 [Saprospiraceae bacterium]